MAERMRSRYRLPKLDTMALDALARFALTNVRRFHDDDVDVMAKARDGRDVVIQLKHLGTLRRDDLLGRLAHAVLTLKPHVDGGKVGMVVVTMPHLTTGSTQAAEELMEKHGGGVQWILSAADGDRVVRAPALGEQQDIWLVRKGRMSGTTVVKTTTAQPFSEMNAWMLKVLLLHGVSERLWGGPRKRVRSATELAKVASVSEPHAYRFVRTFEELDFLRRTEEGLALVRRPALIAAWLEASRQAPRKILPVRWMIGAPHDAYEVFAPRNEGVFARHAVASFDGVLEASRQETRVAFAGFEACRALDVLHAPTTLPELHATGETSDLLARYSLEVAGGRDAHFHLIVQRSDAVFRGMLPTRGGVPTVDVLQAALDVMAHPARGREQAEHIVHGVLGMELP